MPCQNNLEIRSGHPRYNVLGNPIYPKHITQRLHFYPLARKNEKVLFWHPRLSTLHLFIILINYAVCLQPNQAFILLKKIWRPSIYRLIIVSKIIEYI